MHFPTVQCLRKQSKLRAIEAERVNTSVLSSRSKLKLDAGVYVARDYPRQIEEVRELSVLTVLRMTGGSLAQNRRKYANVHFFCKEMKFSLYT